MVLMDMEDDAVVVEDPSAQMVSHIPVAAHTCRLPSQLLTPVSDEAQEQQRSCLMLTCSFLLHLLCCAVAGLQFCLVRCAGVRVRRPDAIGRGPAGGAVCAIHARKSPDAVAGLPRTLRICQSSWRVRCGTHPSYQGVDYSRRL